MQKLIAWFIDKWMVACPHRDEWVAADIMEGEGDTEVKYCRRCGAVRRQFEREFRRPRPLWYCGA